MKKNTMNESSQKAKKIFSTAFVVLFVILIIAARPSFDIKSNHSQKSLAEQYAEHGAVKNKEIHGIDISHEQGNIDWVQVERTDVSFVYVKATDGITYHDPKFHANMETLSQDTELLYGAYHFFEAEDDPEKQADNFLKHILVYPLKLKPMIDVEVTKNQQADLIKKRLQIFINKVVEKTGCSPIIYSYKDFWETNIGPHFNDYVFWLADYSQQMKTPKYADNLQIWQYSESGTVKGISGQVDLDVIVDGVRGLKKITCSKAI